MRYRFLLCVVGLAALSGGCTGDGHFRVLGYSTKPLHDERFRTVYVPIFQNRVFQTGPLRGLENDLTLAVQRQIELATPYKVVSYRDGADTELLVTVVDTQLNILNRNQLNEVREGAITLRIELVWRDLKTGDVLSQSQRGPGGLPLPGDPNLPAPPVTLITSGRFVPELGESQTTALHAAYKQMAVEIVSLMDMPW